MTLATMSSYSRNPHGCGIFRTEADMGGCRMEGDRLILEGEFTIEHAAALKDCLSEAAAGGVSLNVDLAGVTRADISLFQLLASLAKSLGQTGGSVRCFGLGEPLASLAGAAGIKDVLPLGTD